MSLTSVDCPVCGQKVRVLEDGHYEHHVIATQNGATPCLAVHRLYVEAVKFCAISGAAGCLGWPDWHHGECIYEDVWCLFCICGGHDVYGEMYHEVGCPLNTCPVEGT